MGMPVSPLCDRETTDWKKSQLVFLECVVRPVRTHINLPAHKQMLVLGDARYCRQMLLLVTLATACIG